MNNKIVKETKRNMFIIIILIFIVFLFYLLYYLQDHKKYKILLFEYIRPANYYMKDSFNDPSSRFEINGIKMNMGNQLTENRKNLYSRGIVLEYRISDYGENPEKIFPRTRILFDRERKRYVFCDYYVDNTNYNIYSNQIKVPIRWKTMILKQKTFSNLYYLDCEFDVKTDHFLFNENIDKYVDISDDGNFLLTNTGIIIDIKLKKALRKYAKKLQTVSFAFFFNNNLLIISEWLESYYLEEYKINDQQSHYIKTILKFGEELRSSRKYCYVHFVPFITGAKSPDGQKLAFLNPTKQNICLSFYFASNNKIDMGIPIKNLFPKIKRDNKSNKYEESKDTSYVICPEEPIVVWGNIPAKGLIAEYDEYSIIDANNRKKESENKETGMIVICDVNKKSIVDRINIDFGVRSLRWSPDDKKLGILANIENKPRGPLYKGVLYIYDLDTKKLTKLMDCPDCFDFHFVE